MVCPACKSEMIIVEHHNIELDYCTSCRGVWFDAGELELLLQSLGMGEHHAFLEATIASAEASSTEKRRKCPICVRKMKKVLIPGSEVLVDACRNGHGIWFDGGEVAHLLAMLGETSPGRPEQEVIGFLKDVFQYEAPPGAS